MKITSINREHTDPSSSFHFNLDEALTQDVADALPRNDRWSMYRNHALLVVTPSSDHDFTAFSAKSIAEIDGLLEGATQKVAAEKKAADAEFDKKIKALAKATGLPIG
ncbi:MAG: hypothetical protein EOO28_11955 [Comamonadaceae bacterium]|nr:MAG: hypothetical protein EOO28_11955 [Comamonadaceae bacterium]